MLGSCGLPEITSQELHTILRSLPSCRSSGCDRIRLSDIKRNLHIVGGSILAILNGTFRTGVIPAALKRAIVRPIYKNGQKNRVENYRPISLLPTLAVIMEKYVHSIMTNFIEKMV